MRSTASSDPTIARIRSAAIDCFGRSGFTLGLRSVASAAGVSAGLIVHHFGSRDGLERACDDLVAQTVRERKQADAASSTMMVSELFAIDRYAPQMIYLLRRLQAGGQRASELLETLIDDAHTYIDAGVEAGTITPSRDPRARAQYLTLTTIGALTLQLTMRGDLHESELDPAHTLQSLAAISVGPALELYTEGFFTSRDMLDSYLEHQSETPWADRSTTEEDDNE